MAQHRRHRQLAITNALQGRILHTQPKLMPKSIGAAQNGIDTETRTSQGLAQGRPPNDASALPISELRTRRLARSPNTSLVSTPSLASKSKPVSCMTAASASAIHQATSISFASCAWMTSSYLCSDIHYRGRSLRVCVAPPPRLTTSHGLTVSIEATLVETKTVIRVIM